MCANSISLNTVNNVSVYLPIKITIAAIMTISDNTQHFKKSQAFSLCGRRWKRNA